MKKLAGAHLNFAKQRKKFGLSYFRQHLQSQKYALEGLVSIFKEELNFRIELLFALFALAAALLFKITSQEFLIVSLTIMLVLFAEIFNSVVERLCDIYTSGHNVHIKFIKDAAASGVLLLAFGAIVVGITIFLPYISVLLK